MLRHNAFFVRCVKENAYLATNEREWLILHPRGFSTYGANAIGTWSYRRAVDIARAVEWPYGKRHMSIEPAPVCACCGKHALKTTLKEVSSGPPRQWRCDRHVGRNPCLIEGCGRTSAGKRPQLGTYICGTHWKLVPRKMKLVYSRIWRLQKKSGGWTDQLVVRYWRTWERIARAAVRAGRGEVDLDIREIEKLFGVD
jgi:hypothetical protein